MNEEMNMHGAVTVQLSDREGRVIYELRQNNRIVFTGRDLVARLFAGTTGGTPPSKVTHIAVGWDGTPATDDQTALGKEWATKEGVLLRKPIEKVEIKPDTGTGIKRARASLSAVFDFKEVNGTDPLREAGLFTAATGGVMYNRVVFDAVTKTDAFQLTLLWDITF